MGARPTSQQPRFLYWVSFCDGVSQENIDQTAPCSKSTQGDIIITYLRVFVGACILLAVMGVVVSVPLGWAIVLGIGEAYPEKIRNGQPYQRNNELVQKKNLPRSTYGQIKYKIEAKQK